MSRFCWTVWKRKDDGCREDVVSCGNRRPGRWEGPNNMQNISWWMDDASSCIICNYKLCPRSVKVGDYLEDTCLLIMFWHSTHSNSQEVCVLKSPHNYKSFLSTSGKNTLLTIPISSTLTCYYLSKQEVQYIFVQYGHILQIHANFALIHWWSLCWLCVMSVSPDNTLNIRHVCTFLFAGFLVRKDHDEVLISRLQLLQLKETFYQRLKSLHCNFLKPHHEKLFYRCSDLSSKAATGSQCLKIREKMGEENGRNCS